MGKKLLAGFVGLSLLLGAIGAWAAIPGTDLWEPSLARTPGQNGSQWYATVWIHNPGTQTAHVTVSFLVRDQSNPSPARQTVTVDPGETLKLGDVFQDLFGLSQAIGALRFQSDRKIVVGARSYNLTSAGIADSQGQFVAGMPAEIALGSGEKTSIPGITNPADGSFRSNFAMVETAGSTATVQVTLYDRNGVQVASKTYTLSPYEPIQVSMHAFNAGATVDGGRWDVEVLSGSGKVLAFASMVGSGTVSQDPSTLEMEYELTAQSSGSGLTRVAHDSTLAGDGTSSSPLGIADGGVTAAKISGSGASSGQVLKFNGTGVSWAADEELTLPHTAELASDDTLFRLTNDGSGGAVYARSSSATAIFGASDTDKGVMGISNSEVGVYGQSSETYGLYGVSHSANGAAVGGYDVWGGDGVVGFSADNRGVHGRSQSGIGVSGEGTDNGIGVFAHSANGVALKAISDTWIAAWISTGSTHTALLVDGGAAGGDLIKARRADDTSNTLFRVSSTGQVYADGSFHSGGADFAEMYPANSELAPGTVVGIGTNGKLEPATATRAGAVMGVISDKPTIVGGVAVEGEGDHGKLPVAILGIVKVRASAASGPIEPGDLLTPGSSPGTAVKAVWAYPGTIIGKALEGLPSGDGMIRMLVTLR